MGYGKKYFSSLPLVSRINFPLTIGKKPQVNLPHLKVFDQLSTGSQRIVNLVMRTPVSALALLEPPKVKQGEVCPHPLASRINFTMLISKLSCGASAGHQGILKRPCQSINLNLFSVPVVSNRPRAMTHNRLSIGQFNTMLF